MFTDKADVDCPEEALAENGTESEESKKKKKKRKPRGKGGNAAKDPLAGPVSEDYPDGNFPIGEIMDHPPATGMDYRTAKDRYTSEEARASDRMHNDIYNEARQAAEAHRRTRKHIKEWVRRCLILKCCISIFRVKLVWE